MDYDVPLTTKQVRNRVREEIEKNRQINDIRTIDMLVVKVRIEFFLYSHSREAIIISCFISLTFNFRAKWIWSRPPKFGNSAVTLWTILINLHLSCPKKISSRVSLRKNRVKQK